MFVIGGYVCVGVVNVGLDGVFDIFFLLLLSYLELVLLGLGGR